MKSWVGAQAFRLYKPGKCLSKSKIGEKKPFGKGVG